MKSGSTLRNLILLILYFFLLPVVIIVLPILMGVLVARNYGGWAHTFSRLPGVSVTGGWKSGIIAAVYVFGILLIVGAVTDGGDASTSETELEGAASDTSADTASSDSSPETEDASSEPAAAQTDDNSDSKTSTDDSSESNGADETDESATEIETDEPTSNDESTTASASSSESDTEDESSETGSSDMQATDDDSTTSESSTDTTEPDEPVTTDDSVTHSTASVPSEVSGGDARYATVTRVIDGDTMEVEFSNGEEDTVRLIGVDTPETTLGNVNPSEYEGISDTPEARDHLYNWGQEASHYATEELEGHEVRVVTDADGDRRGSFGRLLAYLYIGEENFNRELLEGGYARVYDSSFSMRAEFDSTESEARSNDVGLWDFEDDSSPSDSSGDESDSDSEDEVDIPPVPADGDYDCSHFDTQAQAQAVFEDTAGDPHRLDADGDGVVCETLP